MFLGKEFVQVPRRDVGGGGNLIGPEGGVGVPLLDVVLHLQDKRSLHGSVHFVVDVKGTAQQGYDEVTCLRDDSFGMGCRKLRAVLTEVEEAARHDAAHAC